MTQIHCAEANQAILRFNAIGLRSQQIHDVTKLLIIYDPDNEYLYLIYT